MRCRLYVLVYVEDKCGVGCVGIYGGLMRCWLCRYIWGINEMLAV